MPRSIPSYQWPLTSSLPLKGEKDSHVMKGKSKGRGFKTSTAPKQLSKRSNTFANEVHYGGSKTFLRSLQSV